MAKRTSVEKPRAAAAAPEIVIPATPHWIEEVVAWWFAGFRLATRLPLLFLEDATRAEDLRRLRSDAAAAQNEAKPPAARRQPAKVA